MTLAAIAQQQLAMFEAPQQPEQQLPGPLVDERGRGLIEQVPLAALRVGEDGRSFDKKAQGLPVDPEQHPHGHPGPAGQQRRQPLRDSGARRRARVASNSLASPDTGWLSMWINASSFGGRMRQW